eukprot:TRINITY_DN8651_c0_g1_i2.p2 TRINITY_DN8651_c0_g1~~TRINITY_DN8651_c0_g1_i2.p2  ORF type:complete len:102 (+),score=9.79 TRINITY_DN8651_c0_g1_i2:325-630(+)
MDEQSGIDSPIKVNRKAKPQQPARRSFRARFRHHRACPASLHPGEATTVQDFPSKPSSLLLLLGSTYASNTSVSLSAASASVKRSPDAARSSEDECNSNRG